MCNNSCLECKNDIYCLACIANANRLNEPIEGFCNCLDGFYDSDEEEC